MAALIVATGLLMGAIGLLFADKLVPHEHPTAGRHGPDWMIGGFIVMMLLDTGLG